MFIENPDAFKSWLTSILEPLCDADPAALAKYVYALVKKDKPIEELREGMLDQLDVFLQHETKPFVDMLFKSLESNDYLQRQASFKQPSPPPLPAQDAAVEPAAEPQTAEEQRVLEPPASNGAAPPSPRAAAPAPPPPPAAPAPPRQRVVIRGEGRPHHEQTLVKVLPLTELLEEPVDNQPPRRRDRRGDEARDKDERRRRRSRSWERRGRVRRSDQESRRFDKRRLVSRSPSPRRYRNRSPPPALIDRPPTRSRSRSPIPVRDRAHDRDGGGAMLLSARERQRVPARELERDRMSRDRDHRDRAAHSRDRDRSRERSRSAGTPTQDNERLMPVGKRRCRDFDEKGYCMRGDLCQWDHGADPLVLEDTALSRVLSMPRVPEYNPLTPDIWSSGPPPPGIPYPPHHHLPPPPRELIPIPRIRDVAPPMTAVMPPQMPPIRPPMPKKNFDYNRLGPQRPQMGNNSGNCSLEVKKVPRGMNDITHLNKHFSKFGRIVNIQVCFEGDPEAALITFSNHTEANVAYKSTEAVLNNRFIKVFWHNPESKQENVPPTNAGAQKANSNNTQGPNPHTGSLNKVLINKDNMKQTAENKLAATEKQAKEALSNGSQDVKMKEVPKPLERQKQVMEMHRRAQSLLETQLQQQTLLITKLESGNVTGAQKSALMEAINSAQEGIEKLQKELLAYNKMLMQVQANAKRPKTREEAQKEILDAELDMFTKQQEGQDVTELMKRIAELRRQMAVQFPPHPAARRPHPRGGGGGARYNTATRFSRNNIVNNNNITTAAAMTTPAAPKVFSNSVDHRPRALLISGFEADELDGLVKHFSQFGEVTGKELNPAVPELVLQYKARAHAELAAARGRHYNERTLTITWVTGNKPIAPVNAPAVTLPAPAPAATPAGTAHNGSTTTEPQNEGTESVAVEMSEDALLRFDEEEEDDADEDRSWRR